MLDIPSYRGGRKNDLMPYSGAPMVPRPMLTLVPRDQEIEGGGVEAASTNSVSIPLELIYNPSKLGLRATDFAVLTVLVLILKIEGGETRITKELIGQRVNVSRTTVSRTLCRLAYLGFIRLAHQGRSCSVGEMLRLDEINRRIEALRQSERERNSRPACRAVALL